MGYVEKVSDLGFAGTLLSSTPDALGGGGVSKGDITTRDGYSYTEVSTTNECDAGASGTLWDTATVSSGMSSTTCSKWCTDTGVACMGWGMGVATDSDPGAATACRLYIVEGTVGVATPISGTAVLNLDAGTATATSAVVAGAGTAYTCNARDVVTAASTHTWMCTNDAPYDTTSGKNWYEQGYDNAATAWYPAAATAFESQQFSPSHSEYIGLFTTASDSSSPLSNTGYVYCKYKAPLPWRDTWCTEAALSDIMDGTIDSRATCAASCESTSGCNYFLFGDDIRFQHPRCTLWASCSPRVAPYGFGSRTTVYALSDVDTSELLSGGSFEEPIVQTWQMASASQVGIYPPGWTVTSGNVEWGQHIRADHCTDTCAAEGQQFADMCGSLAGAIKQTATTVATTTYTLSFKYNAHGDCGAATKQMQVKVDDVLIDTLSKTRCGNWGNFGGCWSTASYEVVADDESTDIELVSVSSSCGCMTVDDISFKARNY